MRFAAEGADITALDICADLPTTTYPRPGARRPGGNSWTPTRSNGPPLFMGALPDPVSEPEDSAAVVAWLASDEARHVTGIQLPVDLGRTNR